MVKTIIYNIIFLLTINLVYSFPYNIDELAVNKKYPECGNDYCTTDSDCFEGYSCIECYKNDDGTGNYWIGGTCIGN